MTPNPEPEDEDTLDIKDSSGNELTVNTKTGAYTLTLNSQSHIDEKQSSELRDQSELSINTLSLEFLLNSAANLIKRTQEKAPPSDDLKKCGEYVKAAQIQCNNFKNEEKPKKKGLGM